MLRVTEEERAKAKETLEEMNARRRDLDRQTLSNLRDARNEGWLGWHPCKQEPEHVIPERRMQNAHVALTKALHPRPEHGRQEWEDAEEEEERSQFELAPRGPTEAPSWVPTNLSSPRKGGALRKAAPQDEDEPQTEFEFVTPPRRSPSSTSARSPQSSRGTARGAARSSRSPSRSPSREGRLWLGYSTAEAAEVRAAPPFCPQPPGPSLACKCVSAHIGASPLSPQLLRALNEATGAGNQNSRNPVYEACVQEATRVLSHLKREGRAPPTWRSQLPHPSKADELARLGSARREEELSVIQAAVEAAQARARSPPKSITSLHEHSKSARLKTARLKSARLKASRTPRLKKTKSPSTSRQPGTSSSRSPGSISTPSRSPGSISTPSRSPGSISTPSRLPGAHSSTSSISSSELTPKSALKPSKSAAKAKGKQYLTLAQVADADGGQPSVSDSEKGTAQCSTPAPSSKCASRAGPRALVLQRKLNFEHCAVPDAAHESILGEFDSNRLDQWKGLSTSDMLEAAFPKSSSSRTSSERPSSERVSSERPSSERVLSERLSTDRLSSHQTVF